MTMWLSFNIFKHLYIYIYHLENVLYQRSRSLSVVKVSLIGLRLGSMMSDEKDQSMSL